MRRSILVVEDDDVLRELTAECLASLPSVQVAKCSNADDALLMLADGFAPDLVFTDVHMPGKLDGLDLTIEIWNRWPALPVLLTSGEVTPGVEDLPGNTTFLSKPWSISALFGALRARLPGLKEG